MHYQMHVLPEEQDDQDIRQMMIQSSPPGLEQSDVENGTYMLDYLKE
jgi:hypothetical protein